MPRIAVEPGRAIAGPGTVTLYEVGTLKDVPLGGGAGRRYVSVDGGMSDNIRTALYDAVYDCRLVSRAPQRDGDAARPVLSPGGRQALRERRHRGARLLAAGRPRARRPARGGRHRRLLLLDGQLLQPAAAPGGRRRARRRGAGAAAPGDRRGPVPAGGAYRHESAATDRDGSADRSGSRCSAAAPSAREVVRLLREQADELAARVGAPVELVGVAVRRPHKHRRAAATCSPPTRPALVTRDDVDVVVEVIGGIEPARTLLLEALKAGKSVVTANKALLAEDGAALAEAADASGADLYYEASVAGAIPLLRPLRESLAGDRITRVTGIVNGTTNFILSAMDASGAELRRGAGGGHPAGLRRGRPDRRRRRLRRRVQGRDPRLAGLPHPGHRRRRVPRGHPRGHRGRHRRGRRARLRDQAAGDLRAHRRPTATAPESVSARVLPGDDPAPRTRWPPSTARSTRCSSRPRPPGS